MTIGPGRALEAAVATYFATNGYEVEMNAVELGRSGARHEVDVLARKSDGVISLTVGVECKDWAQPVTKEVVAKASTVFTDLGYSKGLVVAPGGWTEGAGQLAVQLGLEMWGPPELASRGLRTGEAALHPVPSTRTESGWALGIDEEEGFRRLLSRGRRSRAELLWSRVLWLPMWLYEATLTVPRGVFRRNLESQSIWLMADAFAGVVIERVLGESAPVLETLPIGRAGLPWRLDAQKTARRLSGQIEAAQTGGLKAIVHQRALAELVLGLGSRAMQPEASLDFGDASIVFIPLFTACAEKNGRVRFFAIDGRNGTDLRELEEAMAHDPKAVQEVAAALLEEEAGGTVAG